MPTLGINPKPDLDILHRDNDLAQRVKLYLTEIRPELGRLEVRAKAGSVRLAGTVPTYYVRQLAISATKRVTGVQDVIDDMNVPAERHPPCRPR